MSKKRSIIISILYIFLLIIINTGVVLGTTLIFNLISGLKVGTLEYIHSLAEFINKYQILIVLVSMCFWIPLIYKKIKNQEIKFCKINIKRLLLYLLITFIFNCLWNILLYYLGMMNVNNTNSLTITYLIATCLLGPILEEFVFREIIYNKLKKVFNIKTSILLISLFFSLYHLNIIQGIYAFIFSLLLTFIYEKSNNIFMPIVIHSIINLFSFLLIPIILSSNYLLVIFISLIVVGIEVILSIYYKRKNKKD